MNTPVKTRYALSALSILAGAALAGPPRYTITPLDPTDPDGSSWAWAIHADGRVAGARTDSRNYTLATVWTADTAVDFEPYAGKKYAWATSLGSNNAVFGYSRASVLFASPLVGWVSTPDQAPGILNFLPQYIGHQTADVNSANIVAGWLESGPIVASQPVYRAFTVLVDGALRDPTLIPTLGGRANWANALNDQRTVVGGSLTVIGPLNAFVWSPAGGTRALGTLGGIASEAVDINNAGRIVGWAMNAAGARRAFLHDGAAMTDLGTLGGATSEARGINDAGSIVGQSWMANGDLHAFVIHGSAMYDLNTLAPAASGGWMLTRAEDISSAGSIVGWGTRLIEDKRYIRGFRLDPHCAADMDADGVIDFTDYLEFLSLFDITDARADLTADGIVDFGDYLEFLNEYDEGCSAS